MHHNFNNTFLTFLPVTKLINQPINITALKFVNDACTVNWKKLLKKLHKLERTAKKSFEIKISFSENKHAGKMCVWQEFLFIIWPTWVLGEILLIRSILIYKNIWMNNRWKCFVHIPILVILLSIFITKVFSYLLFTYYLSVCQIVFYSFMH